METLSNCPVCRTNKFHPFITCKDYTVSQDNFEIVKCQNCGFKFTNPRPAENAIGKFYESEAYISHSNSRKGLFNKVYHWVREIALGNKIKLIQKYHKKGNLLDIGAGTGEFLNKAKNSGFEVQGIEPSEKARNFAIENYKVKVNQNDFIEQLEANKFDAITMWHVLEHVHQLNNRLEQIHHLLNKNGVAIIAVPNPESLDAQKYKQHWAGYDVPRHLYHFSPAIIQQLFENHQFKLLETRLMPFDSFYVSLLSEKYKTGKMNYFKGFWMGFRSLLHAKINANKGSSQIYVFGLKQ